MALTSSLCRQRASSIQHTTKALAAALLACASPAQSKEPELFLTAFEYWLELSGITEASITVFLDGEPVAEQGVGRDPVAPYPLLSNSKAIAAICLDTLVQEGKANWDDAASQHLGSLIARYGPGAEAITLAQLATHTSGLAVDSTQIPMLGWVNETGLRHDVVSQAALGRGVKRSDVGHYHYNNENYAIIGSVLDQLTGDTDSFCLERTFGAAGAVAERDDTFGSTLAWAGWSASSRDYGLFAWHSFAPGKASDMPLSPPDHGHQYGLGVDISTAGAPYQVGHNGQYCAHNGLDTGAYFAIWESGWMVSANFAGCPDAEVLGELSYIMDDLGVLP